MTTRPSNAQRGRARRNPIAAALREVAKVGLAEPHLLMELSALTDLPAVQSAARGSRDSLALARALVGVLEDLLNELLSDASPDRRMLIHTLFKLDAESKDVLLEARRERLAGSADTSTFRRKVEWPLYEQIARLLMERSAALETTAAADEAMAERQFRGPKAIRYRFAGRMLLYDSAFHNLLYPPTGDREYLYPPSPAGTPLTVFALLLHGLLLDDWQQAVRSTLKGVMEDDDVFHILNTLLHGATPFTQFDQSLLRHAIATRGSGEIAPFQVFVDESIRGADLHSKWCAWLSSCSCTTAEDRKQCSVHSHYDLCRAFAIHSNLTWYRSGA